MANSPSQYSQHSAKKTLFFVIILLSLAAIFAFLAVYMVHKQSTVMTGSTYFEKQAPPATGFPEK